MFFYMAQIENENEIKNEKLRLYSVLFFFKLFFITVFENKDNIILIFV